MLTTFLIVVVVALILGNVFLAVTKSSGGKPEAASYEEPYSTFEPCDDQSAYPVQSPSGRNFIGDYNRLEDLQKGGSETIITSSAIEAINQKIMMAHQRLDSMENAIVKIGKATLESDDTKNGKIKEKLDSLINQKNNTKIEIEALKDRVARLEELNELPHTSREEETEDLKQKIHNLAYNKESA